VTTGVNLVVLKVVMVVMVVILDKLAKMVNLVVLDLVHNKQQVVKAVVLVLQDCMLLGSLVHLTTKVELFKVNYEI
jgi:hypothetical protein